MNLKVKIEKKPFMFFKLVINTTRYTRSFDKTYICIVTNLLNFRVFHRECLFPRSGYICNIIICLKIIYTFFCITK